MTRARWVFVIISGFVVAASVAVFYYYKPASHTLPPRIGTLALVHQVTGDRANEILNRMHDKDVTPARNMIGMYAGGFASAVVYLSVYPSTDHAQRAYEKMARRIDEGSPIFSGYRTVRIGDVDASFCFGQGQDHYFFVCKDVLCWLAADTAIAERTAQELVRDL